MLFDHLKIMTSIYDHHIQIEKKQQLTLMYSSSSRRASSATSSPLSVKIKVSSSTTNASCLAFERVRSALLVTFNASKCLNLSSASALVVIMVVVVVDDDDATPLPNGDRIELYIESTLSTVRSV